MSITHRVTHCRLQNLTKNDVIRFPGGELQGWWIVTAAAPAGTNYVSLTVAQPLSTKGDWIKQTLDPMPYFELVEIQEAESSGSGLGVGVAIPTGAFGS